MKSPGSRIHPVTLNTPHVGAMKSLDQKLKGDNEMAHATSRRKRIKPEDRHDWFKCSYCLAPYPFEQALELMAHVREQHRKVRQ